MIKNYPFLWVLFLFLSFSACQKYQDVDLADYEAEFAVPLLQTSLGMEDVLENFDEDTYITIGDDDLIILNYKGNVTARNSLEIFESINASNGLFPLADTSTVLPFATPDGFNMDYSILSGGRMQIGYESEHDEPMTVFVEVPNLLTPEGEIYTFTKHHSVPIELYLSQEFDLDGFVLKPTNDSIYVNYYAYLENSMKRDTLKSIGLGLFEFSASYVEGYMGNPIYEIPRDTIEIDFFENWTRGDVYFEDPRILVTVINSFGFPVRSKAAFMNIITVDGDQFPLESQFIDSINVDYPRLDEIGTYRTTEFYFTKDNSNIDVVLGSNPVAVDYEMSALANPDQDTTIRGFMTDSSEFIIQVEVELPVFGTASGFVARDTLNVQLDEYDSVDFAEFKIVSENSLPMDINLQTYFLAPDDTIIDSLFTDESPLIASAIADESGDVIQTTEKITFVTVDAEKYARLRNADRVLMAAAFSTYNNGNTSVKVLNSQELEVRMGMKIGVRN